MQPRIACIQMTSTADVNENLEMVKTLVGQAANDNAKLVILPEMFGIMGMDQLAKIKNREQAGHGPMQDCLFELALKHKLWIVGGTIPVAVPNDEKRARAACFVIDDNGNEVARYDKIHLFDVHVKASQENYSESQTIEPGDKVVVIQTPLGRLGLAVCYDLRFPELFRHMLAQKVEIIAVPTAFTYTTGLAHWDVLVKARAIENQVYVAAACQSGTHSNGRKTYGHSMIVNPWGEVNASLAEGNGYIVANIDLAYLHQLRQEFPVISHRKL